MAAQTIGQNTEPTSGPDQGGPIWGYHFVPNQPAQSITSEAAVEFLSAPGPGLPNEFLWLHFSLSNVTSEPWLRRYLTLPETFYESLKSDVDATHLEQDGDSLVARIHDVLFDFTFDAPVATTTVCVKPRVLVSAHMRPWRSIDQLRAAVQAGGGPNGRATAGQARFCQSQRIRFFAADVGSTPTAFGPGTGCILSPS